MKIQKQYAITKISVILFCLIAVLVFMWSCEDNKPDDFSGTPYDPSKPVRIDSFEPDSGGLATKVFISGSNFGNDLSKIKVYFNNVRAPLVGSNGDHIYVLTPRLSHQRECTISVVVGNDSTVLTGRHYLYRTLTTVTTIAGKKGTTMFRGGTLSEAEFDRPHSLCVDDEGNIFLSHWSWWWEGRGQNYFVLINEERNIVRELYYGDPLGAPTVDDNGVVTVPTDPGDGYYYFDRATQWAPRSRLILHPTVEQQAEGKREFNIDWKHGMSYCQLDGHIYTRAYNGNIVKFDPLTRYGELVTHLPMGDNNSYPYFDPNQPNILYIVFNVSSTIYKYDVITGEAELFAGGQIGWKDGYRLDAEFNGITQMVVLQNGDIYVADSNNHCIRVITPDGMVRTLIGKGGVAGYQDGNPDDALFDTPTGIAVGKDGTVYVAEPGNNTIRKLAIE